MYHPTRNSVMSTYNRARPCAKRGDEVRGRKFDWCRNNKALGLALSPKRFQLALSTYNTTLLGCECADTKYARETICKHRNALMIVVRASEAEGHNYKMELLTAYTTSNGDTMVAEQENGHYKIHIWQFHEDAVTHIERNATIDWRSPAQAIGTRVRPDMLHAGKW